MVLPANHQHSRRQVALFTGALGPAGLAGVRQGESVWVLQALQGTWSESERESDSFKRETEHPVLKATQCVLSPWYLECVLEPDGTWSVCLIGLVIGLQHVRPWFLSIQSPFCLALA